MNNNDHRKEIKFYYRYRHLPILSLILLIALAALTVRIHLQRPSRDMRRKLASFQVALELIPEHYPHTSRDDLFQSAMQGIIDSLDDPYSRYLTPQQLRHSDAEAEGQFGGIGIRVAPLNGEAVILELMPDGSAGEANVQPGDIIIKVENHAVADMSFQEVVSAIRGKPGTKVNITFKNPKTDEVKQKDLERRMLEASPIQSEIIDDNIGIIRLPSFNLLNIQRLREELLNLLDAPIDALIVDLRDNPGGLLDAAVDIADMFIDSGRIVAVEYAGEKTEKDEFFATEDIVIPKDMPLAILVNGRSASAAELLAGSLQSLNRATVIGTNTFGKGSVDSIFTLPDGSGLVLKIASYIVGEDIKVEGEGVTPDLVVGEIPSPLELYEEEERREWMQKYREAMEIQEKKAVEYLVNIIGETANE